MSEDDVVIDASEAAHFRKILEGMVTANPNFGTHPLNVESLKAAFPEQNAVLERLLDHRFIDITKVVPLVEGNTARVNSVQGLIDALWSNAQFVCTKGVVGCQYFQIQG